MYIPETGKPIELHPEQQVVIRAMFRRDERGFLYSTMVYSSIKKSAKTTIGAGLALWQAYRIANGEIYIVGNDLKQADNRMNKAIRYCIENNPQMADAKITRLTTSLPNGTRIEAVPVDAAGEAGSNPTGIFWTEAWGAKKKKHEEMWSEMALSPTRQGESFKLVESYAGHIGESLILERLHKAVVKPENKLDDSISPELYVHGRTIVYWNTRRYLFWQIDNKEYYEQEELEKSPQEFRRQHHNEWTSSEDVFVPIEWWRACQGELPSLGQYQSVVVGLDAAVSNDCFAINAIFRNEEQTFVLYNRVWYPPPKGQIDFSQPEAEIRRLAQDYNVVEFAYDPYQLHDMATRLRRDGVGHFREFNQGQDRLKADKRLYDTIRDRKIVHSGEPDLFEHVRNANQKSDGDKLRIIKRSEDLKIDACVALSMANERARYLLIG